MRRPTLVRLLLALCAALSLVLVLATGSVVHAQVHTGVGLITAVDLATNTLVLETRTGPQRVRVAPTATIRGHHGAVLAIRNLTPGDAVSYQTASDTATGLRVARQFWAIPREW